MSEENMNPPEISTANRRGGNKVEPIHYHAPGWIFTLGEGAHDQIDYIVWAPGEVTDDGISRGRTRDYWAAAWDSVGALRGDYRRGGSLEEVLTIFESPRIRDRFREAIGGGNDE